MNTITEFIKIEQLQELILASLKDTLNKDQQNPYIEDIKLTIDSKEGFANKFLTTNFFDVIENNNLENDNWHWLQQSDEQHVEAAIDKEISKFYNKILAFSEHNEEDIELIENSLKDYLTTQISETDLQHGYHEIQFKLIGDATFINEDFVSLNSLDEAILNNNDNFNLIKIDDDLILTLNKLQITAYDFLESYIKQIKKIFIKNELINEQGEYLITQDNIDINPLYYGTWYDYLKPKEILNPEEIDDKDYHFNYYKNNNFLHATECLYVQLLNQIDNLYKGLNLLEFKATDKTVNLEAFIQSIIDNNNTQNISFNLITNIDGDNLEYISKNIDRNNIQLNNDMEYNYIRMDGELQNNSTTKNIQISNLIIKNKDLYLDDENTSVEYNGQFYKLYSDNTYSLIQNLHEYNHSHSPHYPKPSEEKLSQITHDIEQQINEMKNTELVPFYYLKENAKKNPKFLEKILQKEIDHSLIKNISSTLITDDKEQKAKEIAKIITTNEYCEQILIINIINEHLKEPLQNLNEHPLYYWGNKTNYKLKLPIQYLNSMLPEHCLFLKSKTNNDDVLNILLRKSELNIATTIIEHPNFNPKNIINGRTYLFTNTNTDIQILLASKGVDPTYTDSNNKLPFNFYYQGNIKEEFFQLLQQKFLEGSIKNPETTIKKLKI